VKQFFNEKEVTSTLVMDALFAGCRCIDEATRLQAEVSKRQERLPPCAIREVCLLSVFPATSGAINADVSFACDFTTQGKPVEGGPLLVCIDAMLGTISLGLDVVDVAERASKDFIPTYRDDKVCSNPTPAG